MITACLDEPADRIRDTLATISAQTYRHFEHVVVDGGSAAATLAALAASAGDTTRVLSGRDGGITNACNRGVAAGRGDLVLFVHIGDRLAGPEALAALVAAVRANPGNGLYLGDWVDVRPDGRRALRRAPPMTGFHLYRRPICHSAVLARRELFDHVGPLDPGFAPLADQDWFLRVLAAGFAAATVDATVCEYELGGDSARDPARFFAARTRIRRRHFPAWQRAAYFPAAQVVNATQRLQARDFSLPMRIAALLARRRRRP